MSSETSTSLQPWQFFVLAALGCATAVTFIARGEGVMAVILLSALMGGAALVGIAALRTFGPLVTGEEERGAALGQRTRAALEREKMLTLRSIKELEFDHAMGKLSDEDWKEMSGRLRARAMRLIGELDAGGGYRDQIEREVARRVNERQNAKSSEKMPTCAACSTRNDPDARFCKNCGQKL
jgi:hypothetical protein